MAAAELVEELEVGEELRHARKLNERRKGLAGLDELPAAIGLQIHGCNSVHTFAMRGSPE